MKTTYFVIDPAGEVHTRTSNRTYKYAVVARKRSNPSAFFCMGFRARFDLAKRLANEASGSHEPIILPVSKKGH